MAATAMTASPFLVRASAQDSSDLRIDFRNLQTRDYKSLQKNLIDGGSMFRPQTAGYADVAAIQTANLQVNPPIVIRPRSAAEVSGVIGWCRERSIFPRVRSGGHSYAGYSTGDTLVLDLRDLNAVSVDRHGVAAVGAGTTLGEVSRRLHCDAGMRLPSGSCPSVGISGLSLVGGHGAMTNRWGLTLDRLVAAEVVLADGSTTICSEQSDSGLFWALRGGGAGSFGVVTNLWYDAVPWSTTWRGIVRWDWSAFKNVYGAWRFWIDSLPEETTAVISFKSSANGGQVIVVIQDETSESTVTSQLDALVDGVPDRPVQAASVSAVNTPACEGSDPLSPGGSHRKSLLASAAPTTEIADIALDWRTARTLDPVLATGGTATMLINRWGGAMAEPAPGDTAWVHRDARIVTQIYESWPTNSPSKARDAAVLRWMRGFHDELRPHYDLGAYQGYWDPDVVNWPEVYYGDNFNGLVTVKSAYDPEDFFRFQRSIPTSI